MKRVLVVLAVALSAATPTLAAMKPHAPHQQLRAMLGGAVDTNPRLTARREWRGMSWGQKVARAKRQYNRTWAAAGKLYGGGAPPPMQVGPAGGNAALTRTDMPSPYVEISPGLVRALAKPKALFSHEMVMPSYNKVRADARETLLHEWDHYHQNPAILNDPNMTHREEAAELFASLWGHRLFGSDPYGARRQASRDLASAYGPGYWRRGQFSGP